MATNATERSKVFPAYAGMIPHVRVRMADRRRVPRIRGDDPKLAIANDLLTMCSPHTRG